MSVKERQRGDRKREGERENECGGWEGEEGKCLDGQQSESEPVLDDGFTSQAHEKRKM